MVLGCYYLTADNITSLLGANHYFSNLEDVLLAYNQKKVEIHSSIWIKTTESNLEMGMVIKKVPLKDGTVVEYYNKFQVRKSEDNNILAQYIQTTTGRAILNYTIKKTLNFL